MYLIRACQKHRGRLLRPSFPLAASLALITISSAVVLLISDPATGAVPSGSSLGMAESLANPPDACRPTFMWYWPGTAVTDDEIDTEIRAMKQAGFAGA